jgi:ligand-binding sensor domain-containing protein
LSIWDKNREKFARLTIDLPHQSVNTIWQDSRKRLWIGTEVGLVVKDSNNNIKTYKYNQQDSKGLQANPILRIFEDSKKRIWIGTWLGGLHLYQENTDSFQHSFDYLTDTSDLPELKCIFAISESPDNQILIGSFGGLFTFDKSNKQLQPYIPNKTIAYIRDIHKDYQGNLWIGTRDGLHFVNPITKQSQLFSHHSQDSNSLSNSHIHCILEDRKKRVWVGTREGLNLWLKSGKFRRYTTENGLPNNQINGIVEDKKGYLWIMTNQGLTRFNPDNQ